MEQNPAFSEGRQGTKYPCPFGKPYNRIIICSAPVEETGADPEWFTQDRKGHLVTRQFCANRCRKTDVAKPVISGD